MLETLNNLIKFLPTFVACGIALSAIGAVFQSVSDALGKGASPIAQGISKITSILKKITDIASANTPHK